MIIVMNSDASMNDIENVEIMLSRLGFKTHPIFGEFKTVIGAIGDKRNFNMPAILSMPGVEKIVPIMKPFKLASRELKQVSSIIDVDGVRIGGKKIVIFAGPCAVENRDTLMQIARSVAKSGASILRSNVYKPRTSPYSFQGIEKRGLKFLDEAREETGLKIITEVLDTRDVELVSRHCDILQVGARNMQNFRLLQEVGQSGKPILLKRGFSATIEEWLMAAEYIIDAGSGNIILCERGIRTFETSTRNTLDISAIPVVKELSHLPIVIDPSHSSGNWKYVPALSRGAVAAGADGLIIEVHSNPTAALSDGPQSLTPEKFESLVDQLKLVATSVGREI